MAIHGYLMMGEKKMSKSLGNVLDPFVAIERFGADALRFYCFREVSFGQDGSISTAGFEARYEAELANDFGNLASRVLAMVDRYRAGVVPSAQVDAVLEEDFEGTVARFSELLDRAELTQALEQAWRLVRRLNRYVEETRPWELAKDEADPERLDEVLYNLSEGLRVVTLLLVPYLPQSSEQLLAALRQVGDEQQGDDAQALAEVVEDFVEALGVGLVLGQLPGAGLLDVAVEATDEAPGLLQGLGQLGPVEQLAEAGYRAFEVLFQHSVDLCRRHDAGAVAVDHRQHAAGQVAEVVGKLGLVAGLEARRRDRAILAEADLTEAVEAQRVGAKALDDLERVEHVAERLRHLLLTHHQVAVDRHPLRRLEVRRPEQRRPDHRVELEDVLGHHVQVGGPVARGQVLALAGEAECGDVVEQGVEPDVHALLGVPGQPHPPLQLGTRERDVLQPPLDEGDRLVAAEIRHDEVGPFLVEAFELGLEGGEAEEPVLLAQLLQLDLVDRAGLAGAKLALGLEVGAARAVPAFPDALVDPAVVVDALHDLGDALGVARVGGADEEVVGRVDGRHQRFELGGVAVGQLLRRHTLALGGVLDRLAMLVGAGEEEDILAALAHVAGKNVRRHRRVRVPQMGLGVDVVDRRGDVVGHRARG